MNLVQIEIMPHQYFHMDILKLGIFMQIAALKQTHEYA